MTFWILGVSNKGPGAFCHAFAFLCGS